MNLFKKKATALVATALLFQCWLGLSQVAPAHGQTAPAITVDPSTQDYGQVLIDSSGLQMFAVSNTGNADLEIKNCALYDGETTEFSLVTGSVSFTLSPGQTRSVVVRFKPTSEGGKSTTLRFVSNDPDEGTKDVSLTGAGVSTLSTANTADSGSLTSGGRNDDGPVVISAPTPASIANFSLEQNDPEPFSHSTSINFSLPVAGNAILEVYDATGQLMRTLAAGEMAPGRYSVRWNGDDQFNRAVAAGKYSYKLEVEDEDGNHLFTQTRQMTLLPSDFQLEQNYPNPFNPSTQIRFDLPQASHVTLKVYTVNGDEVRTVVDRTYAAGRHTVMLNVNNLPSGTYFYMMQAGTVRKVHQFTLVK